MYSGKTTVLQCYIAIFLEMDMAHYKKTILDGLCYTELVYGRINKKLHTNLSNEQIEALILAIVSETEERNFIKKGKNIYVTHTKRNIKLTINGSTNRIITADRLSANNEM